MGFLIVDDSSITRSHHHQYPDQARLRTFLEASKQDARSKGGPRPRVRARRKHQDWIS